MSDRDTPQTRANIDRVANAWRETNAKAGNPITFEQARDRVAGARARGDQNRENGNR